jgi:ribosomal protein S18 acetylase RimI-like enzyme
VTPPPATLQLGLPDHLRDDAARLYWQAFGSKLGLVLGPEPRALRLLGRAMRADQVIIALAPDGRLLGIAGFKTPNGSFASGGPQDMRAVYGVWGAYWRQTVLGWLSDGVDNDRFLLDGLCVDAGCQGQGLGTALLSAITAEARLRGYNGVRLEVIDRNTRAIALYERLGFAVTARQNIGALRWVFKFSAALTMVKPL